MKKLQLVTTVPFVLALLSLQACGGGEATPEPQSPGEMPSEAPPPPPEPATPAPQPAEPAPAASAPAPEAPPPAPAASLTDEQVAAITDAANTGEVEQAKVAQKRSKDAKVKKFAAMMTLHHTQAKQKQAQLLAKLKVKPEQNPKSEAMTQEGTSVVTALKQVDAGSFDQSYIASQVDAHQKVLDALDSQLIPSVKNAELRAALEEFRPKVEEHLRQAKEIQAALPAASSGGQGATSGSGAPSADPRTAGKR